MAPKKEAKGTARRKIRKVALKELGPTGRKAKAVKGGFVVNWKGGQGTS